MENILIMGVAEAYEKSKSSELAKDIWNHKHPGEEVNANDREYVSWLNSTPHFLKAAVNAGLGNLDVVFELPTPLGDYIDVALVGKSYNLNENEFGRLLIVELKQWSTITQIEEKDYVEISVGNGQTNNRRHPISQICEYESHMSRNHHGIYKNDKVTIDSLVHLHNFGDCASLLTGPYSEWSEYSDKLFVKGDEERLVDYLRNKFLDENNANMPSILDDCGYVMDEAGFAGLNAALNGEENATMVKDQMAVVDCVREHLAIQKDNPHQEIIVVSGGPGTGKTIIGMHFIYDYADIFNNKANADGSVFCLPKSRTVKAMIDYECRAEVVPYLDRINRNQNLVVVDESHRITGIESTLNSVFDKGTKLLVMLQDDHQRIRAGEDGTLEGIRAYAEEKGIKFTSLNLTIQKRCESLGKLLDGLEKMFYGEGAYDGKSITSVKVFDRIRSMNSWVEQLAESSRAKLIAPYCWKWNGRADVRINDNGDSFEKSWNPGTPGEQVRWYYDVNRANQVASIYTCQGLDFDDVAFIWWNDLVWDETENRWKSNLNASEDNSFKKGVIEAGLSKEEIDLLFINTYYVMLSRARNRMGIWFKDEATRRYVTEFLGLDSINEEEDVFVGADSINTVIEIQTPATDIIGNNRNRSYHRPSCKYAPRNPAKRVEFTSNDAAINAGYRPCGSCNP
jgi:uncharacterized protein